MGGILEQTTNWLREMLVGGIMSNLSGMSDSIGRQVGEIAVEVGMTPEAFSLEVFSIIRNVSEPAIIPIAGLILAFITYYELIQMVISHNNLNNFETWIFFRQIFKTFVAAVLITNTFSITMAVPDVANHVIEASGGIITGDIVINPGTLDVLEETLMGMEIGPLLGLFLQPLVVQTTISVLSTVIFIIAYGRVIEVYLVISLTPIPLSTFRNREQSQVGQSYLRLLFALGFQGFLIMVCVGIYAVLISKLVLSDGIIMSIWGIMGYTVLLCFTLFKIGSLTKNVFNAHQGGRR